MMMLHFVFSFLYKKFSVSQQRLNLKKKIVSIFFKQKKTWQILELFFSRYFFRIKKDFLKVSERTMMKSLIENFCEN